MHAMGRVELQAPRNRDVMLGHAVEYKRSAPAAPEALRGPNRNGEGLLKPSRNCEADVPTTLRLSPHLPASPALGACRQYRLSNPLEGLIGSKTFLSAPSHR